MSKYDNHARPHKRHTSRPSLGTPLWILTAVGALALGIILGHFLMPSTPAGDAVGRTTIPEGQLDSAVAAYTYDGETHTITYRQVIEQTATLDSAKTSDGSYTVPSADAILACARDAVVSAEADKRGITVSDDDRDAYAQETVGSTDYDSIASSYGISTDTVKDLIANSAKMAKLRDQVIDTTSPEEPTAPAAPDDGDETATSKDYADYIIALAGDEWDSQTGTWASADGAYATALNGYAVTADSASYGAAEAAYQVAYSAYYAAQSQISTRWTNYVNDILSKASIQVSTLAS